jgi:glutathione synthase/RimK-type ligase-like ATP-grasp enzyme
MTIAYITYSGQVKYSAANGFNEQVDLLPYLQQKGLDIKSVIWDDASVDWTKYDVALLKTPWDYHHKIDAFKAWLDTIESLKIRLLNSYDLVRQNIDKHYLKDIIDKGFAVIPSVFLDKGWRGDLDALFTQLHSDAIIIKPCVSGGSKDTVVVRKENAVVEYEPVVGLLTKGDFIAQPLMKDVEEGEWSFIFFNGAYSHTILKKPKQGDFRVQQIYGGTIETIYPTPAEIQNAATYVEHFAKDSLYARVDGLMVNGQFILMELELTEPFLYLSYGENAVERYYQALIAQLGNQ